jgi:hypothetical protein
VIRIEDHTFARVPGGLAPGSYEIVVINREGCRSQEPLRFQVTAKKKRCGLLGIELLPVLGPRHLRRRLRRAGSC